MKTKDKLLTAVVLCTLFVVALPGIAAAQEDDYVLDIYGNANEDDTIDMRDLTYVKLIFFGKKPETELSDAKYDGKINPLDFVQIKLIIVGKEKELTLIDSADRTVTVKKPVKRIVAGGSACEVLRTLKSKDKIAGIDRAVAVKKEFFPELSKLPNYGSFHPPYDVDIEKLISINPDFLITATKSYIARFEDVLEGTDTTIVCLPLYKPESQSGEIRKLGYILDKEAEAEEFIDWAEGHVNIIEERVDGLSEDEKPRVFVAFIGMTPSKEFYAYSDGSGMHQSCTLAGGINIVAAAGVAPGKYGIHVDPEWVIAQNPDIIVAATSKEALGYEVDEPSKVKAVRDELMNRPELAHVAAVEDGKVYFAGWYVLNPMYFVGITHVAKCFHPDLFEDLDPEAITKEYLERFQGVPHQGIYVYPPLE